MRQHQLPITVSLKVLCITLGLAFFGGAYGIDSLLLMLDESVAHTVVGLQRAPGDTEEEREGNEKEDDDKSAQLMVEAQTGDYGDRSCGGMQHEACARMKGHRSSLLRPPLG